MYTHIYTRVYIQLYTCVDTYSAFPEKKTTVNIVLAVLLDEFLKAAEAEKEVFCFSSSSSSYSFLPPCPPNAASPRGEHQSSFDFLLTI